MVRQVRAQQIKQGEQENPNDIDEVPVQADRLDIAGVFLAEFDRAEPYPRIALRLRRMQLPQCDDGLAVTLLIERNRCTEEAGIGIFVGAMINLDQARPIDPTE